MRQRLFEDCIVPTGGYKHVLAASVRVWNKSCHIQLPEHLQVRNNMSLTMNESMEVGAEAFAVICGTFLSGMITT